MVAESGAVAGLSPMKYENVPEGNVGRREVFVSGGEHFSFM